MVEAIKCLIVQDGIISLIDGDSTTKIVGINEKDVSISIYDGGIVVVLKGEIVIPIPEEIIDYFIDNSTITVYPFSPANFMEKPIVTVNLSRDAIVQAKSIYCYSKEKT